MTNDKYILLPDHTVREEPNLLAWARWYETADRVVREEQIGPWFISTVFLGIDHNYARQIHPEAPPLLFETMVFLAPDTHSILKNGHNDVQRCSTWDQAVAQHSRYVRQLQATDARLAPVHDGLRESEH